MERTGNITIGFNAGAMITVGHHNICIGNEAGSSLIDESYRLIVKGKTPHSGLVDIDITMTESEQKLLYDVLNVVVVLVAEYNARIASEKDERSKHNTGDDSTNIGKPALANLDVSNPTTGNDSTNIGRLAFGNDDMLNILVTIYLFPLKLAEFIYNGRG